jgi:hypothetical protein
LGYNAAIPGALIELSKCYAKVIEDNPSAENYMKLEKFVAKQNFFETHNYNYQDILKKNNKYIYSCNLMTNAATSYLQSLVKDMRFDQIEEYNKTLKEGVSTKQPCAKKISKLVANILEANACSIAINNYNKYIKSDSEDKSASSLAEQKSKLALKDEILLSLNHCSKNNIESSLSKKAQYLAETYLFNETKKLNEVFWFDDFLKKYPKSIYTGQVKQLIAQKQFSQAINSHNISDIKTFIEDHPSSPQIADARNIYQKKLFDLAVSTNTIKGYKKFIKSSKNKPHTQKARKLMSQLPRVAKLEADVLRLSCTIIKEPPSVEQIVAGVPFELEYPVYQWNYTIRIKEVNGIDVKLTHTNSFIEKDFTVWTSDDHYSLPEDINHISIEPYGTHSYTGSYKDYGKKCDLCNGTAIEKYLGKDGFGNDIKVSIGFNLKLCDNSNSCIIMGK